MFDLEEQLRQWRHELEATLAFSDEEIDELEDHLRLSFEARIKEGITPENSWNHTLSNLGSASALALEFAKDKLMPALGRLVVAWLKPALLAFFLGAIFDFSTPKSGQWALNGTLLPTMWASLAQFIGMTGLGLLAIVILLPDKAQKNAVLAGVGNAVCLIPLLHVLVYNSWTENMAGPGWIHMAASFGWPLICLSLIGLFIVNGWWWKNSASLRRNFSSYLYVTGTLVLILALSPLAGECVGSLSIREVYRMPTASDISYTGETLSHFLQWKFVDVMVGSCIYITNILPFTLLILICAGFLIIHIFTGTSKAESQKAEEIFPSPSTLPWMMTLLGSGLCWIAGHTVEPPYDTQLHETLKSVPYGTNYTFDYNGLETVVILCVFLFFVCAWELTQRLTRASSIRPFYTSILIMMEVLTALFLFLIPALNKATAAVPTPFQSAEPGWCTWALEIAIFSLAIYQIRLISKKIRNKPCEISIWRFNHRNLVEQGLLLGLIYAGSWLIFIMVASVMAFESVSVIAAMIAWGNSVKDPAKAFHPQMYGTPDHLTYWVMTGISYLSFCLTAGLVTIIILSGLEFIRFNGFRLYKIRKVRQELAENLALTE